MRFAIIGAGGVGGYLAHRLAAAGHPVGVLARGRHLAAIRADGLTLIQEDGRESTVRPEVASDGGADLGPADVALFCVKGQDMADAIEAARPVVADGGHAVSFLNGVEGPDMLARAFGEDRALIGTARISAYIDGPGRVRKVTRHARYTLGDRGGRQDRTPVPAIREAFEAAGIDAPVHGDVRVDLWEKFVLLTPFAAVTAGARCDAATIAATPELMALAETLARETIAVAEARGIALPGDQLARTVEGIRELPGEMRASLAHDLAAGKPLETDWLSGAVARLGAEAGVETPAHRTVAALLAPWRHGA